MIQTYQRLQRRRAAGEIDGFTLIELLIVIVVLGILAAIVVFALGGVTGKSASAACQSDAKTLGIAVAALEAENPTLATTGLTTNGTTVYPTAAAGWEATLLAPSTTVGLAGGPFLQSWPSSSSYAVFVGDGVVADEPTAVTGLGSITGTTGSTTGGTNVYGDVYVYGLNTGTYKDIAFNATTNPVEACNFAVLNKA